ncbi:MAG TPA: hypothetical protein PLO94_11465 [Chitinophagales bacterium]|nr:hypothetical protein [Chitinophagales bacterium]
MKIISNNIQQLIAFILLCILIFGCTPKIEPTIEYKTKVDTIYQTKVETILKQRFDTITIVQDDTCELYKMSFNSLLGYYNEAQDIISIQKDSMDYLHALNQVINLPKKVKKNSTITVIQGNNNKSNIDKSETNQKAKDNSAIGQDNELTKTTKKNNWIWIFIAGAVSSQLITLLIKRIILT